MSHEYAFKAHTPEDAQRWHHIISSVAGQTTNEMPETSAPSSPVVGRSDTMGSANSAGTGMTGTTAAGSEGYGTAPGTMGQGGYGDVAQREGGYGGMGGTTNAMAEKEAAGADYGVSANDKARY